MTKRILQSKEKIMCEVFKKPIKDSFWKKKNRLVWTLYYVSALYIFKNLLKSVENGQK